MGRYFVVDRFAGRNIAGVLALGFVATALAGAQPPTVAIKIGVFADRYIVAGRTFDDLDLLEKHITAIHARGVSLLACGPGVTGSLKAAVHRFRHIPEQMSVHEGDDPECFSAVSLRTRLQGRAGQRPRGIDEEAVEGYWRDLMP